MAGVALRLAIAPWGGHPGDVATLTRWAVAMNEHEWLAIYCVSDANYPPLGMALIAWSGWIFDILTAGAVPSPERALWLLLLKLPAILSDAGIGLFIGRLAQERRGAFWLTASVAFNPALIYLSGWWGQLEGIYALCALAAVITSIRQRPFWAGVWLGLGMMVKLQAVVVVPVVVAALFCAKPIRVKCVTILHNNMTGLVAGTALPIVLAMGPFILTGQGGLVVQRVIALISGPGWLTVNALNSWYLITGGAGNWAYNAPLTWPDSAPVIAGIPARAFGTAILLIWTTSILIRAIVRAQCGEESGRWFLVGALLYLGVFLWLTQAHERYAFGAVVMLAGMEAAAQGGTRVIWQSATYYGIITVTHMLNLVWAAPFAPWLAGWFAGQRVVGMVIAATMAVAAVSGWAMLYGWDAAGNRRRGE